MRALIGAAVLAALTLTGCQSDDNGEEQFFAAIDEHAPSLANKHEAALEAGRATCDALDDGYSIETISVGVVSVVPAGHLVDVGVLMGAAAAFLCPEYNDEVQRFADS